MRKLVALLLALTAITMSASAGDQLSEDITSPSDTCYKRGASPFSSIDDRKLFIKHIRDSLDAIPFDTTRDDKYWERCIVNGEWDFFKDTTAKKPKFLNFAYKAYQFYTKAFNNYDSAYVVDVPKDWKVMLVNNDWFDSYGGKIADKRMKVFMNSNLYSSIGAHLSVMGIGYTYLFDLDHLFGGDPSRHSNWEISFATSRFSFELYNSRNSGSVSLRHFGDHDNKNSVKTKFHGLNRRSSGFDMYYFFNHRKYSQAAAYSFSKIQKRSAGSFIAGILIATQNVEIDFSELSDEIKSFLPDDRTFYRYHYRSYSFMLGYAYNWVFRPNWLFNINMAPSIGWNYSFDDSVDGKSNMLALSLRGRLGLVKNAGNFFYGLHVILDGYFYHSKNHNFFNSIANITLSAGFRF